MLFFFAQLKQMLKCKIFIIDFQLVIIKYVIIVNKILRYIKKVLI